MSKPVYVYDSNTLNRLILDEQRYNVKILCSPHPLMSEYPNEYLIAPQLAQKHIS